MHLQNYIAMPNGRSAKSSGCRQTLGFWLLLITCCSIQSLILLSWFTGSTEASKGRFSTPSTWKAPSFPKFWKKSPKDETFPTISAGDQPRYDEHPSQYGPKKTGKGHRIMEQASQFFHIRRGDSSKNSKHPEDSPLTPVSMRTEQQFQPELADQTRRQDSYPPPRQADDHYPPIRQAARDSHDETSANLPSRLSDPMAEFSQRHKSLGDLLPIDDNYHYTSHNLFEQNTQNPAIADISRPRFRIDSIPRIDRPAFRPIGPESNTLETAPNSQFEARHEKRPLGFRNKPEAGMFPDHPPISTDRNSESVEPIDSSNEEPKTTAKVEQNSATNQTEEKAEETETTVETKPAVETIDSSKPTGELSESAVIDSSESPKENKSIEPMIPVEKLEIADEEKSAEEKPIIKERLVGEKPVEEKLVEEKAADEKPILPEQVELLRDVEAKVEKVRPAETEVELVRPAEAEVEKAIAEEDVRTDFSPIQDPSKGLNSLLEVSYEGKEAQKGIEQNPSHPDQTINDHEVDDRTWEEIEAELLRRLDENDDTTEEKESKESDSEPKQRDGSMAHPTSLLSHTIQQKAIPEAANNHPNEPIPSTEFNGRPEEPMNTETSDDVLPRLDPLPEEQAVEKKENTEDSRDNSHASVYDAELLADREGLDMEHHHHHVEESDYRYDHSDLLKTDRPDEDSDWYYMEDLFRSDSYPSAAAGVEVDHEDHPTIEPKLTVSATATAPEVGGSSDPSSIEQPRWKEPIEDELSSAKESETINESPIDGVSSGGVDDDDDEPEFDLDQMLDDSYWEKRQSSQDQPKESKSSQDAKDIVVHDSIDNDQDLIKEATIEEDQDRGSDLALASTEAESEEVDESISDGDIVDSSEPESHTTEPREDSPVGNENDESIGKSSRAERRAAAKRKANKRRKKSKRRSRRNNGGSSKENINASSDSRPIETSDELHDSQKD